MFDFVKYSDFVITAYVLNDLVLSGFAAFVLWRYFKVKKELDAKKL